MVNEIEFDIHGEKIAAKAWHDASKIPTLALHGWLDNAATFDKLAPLLPQLHIVAIDLPGHGHSYHEPPGSYIHLIDFVVSAIQVVEKLGWQRFMLLGHSLGAAICSIIAGAIPDRIEATMLIDALGPLTTPASAAPQQLQLFLNDTLKKTNKRAPRYASQNDALQARLNATPMQAEGAARLVERGTQQLENGEWTWRTDPRLLMPSALQFTEEQTLAFLQAITSPVCVIRPEPGFPFSEAIIKRRLAALKQVEVVKIPGDHHVHLDQPELVANALQNFLNHLAKIP